jgi:DNA-binding transcriptional regulator YiaG
MVLKEIAIDDQTFTLRSDDGKAWFSRPKDLLAYRRQQEGRAQEFERHCSLLRRRYGMRARKEKCHQFTIPPEEILKLREELGLTQKQLAETIGVRKNIVSRWEAGQRIPLDRNAKALKELQANGMRYEFSEVKSMDLVENGAICSCAARAILRGASKLANVPGLIKRIIKEEMWRERRVRTGRIVKLNSFRDLIVKKPLHGWGEDPQKIEAIIRDDPEALALWREAIKEQGKRNDLQVAELRKSLGLSQAKFSYLVGVSKVTVWKWERGIAEPWPLAAERLNQVAKESKFFNVAMTERSSRLVELRGGEE